MGEEVGGVGTVGGDGGSLQDEHKRGTQLGNMNQQDNSELIRRFCDRKLEIGT